MKRLLLAAILILLACGFPPQTAAANVLQALDGDSHPPLMGMMESSIREGLEIPSSFELMAENDLFQLFAEQESLAFKILDKRSGYIWQSNLDEKGEGDRLNKTWTAFARSGISIDYLDQKAVDKRLSIINSEHTLDFKPIDQGFEAAVTFTDVSITVAVRVTLEADGVRVEVPFELIKEEDDLYKLGMLHVYPFMGATREDSIPGYMFIPDGPGSLIRFASTTKAENMFYGRYYGPDLGMLASLPWDPMVIRAHTISIPVFGMVHGEKQNAYVAIVEKGASYGQLMAHPSGVITNFNFLYSGFIYNESYFQATSRSGDGVITLQRDTNVFDISIHYRFLTGDESNYTGMARSYQRYLVDRGDLKKITDEGTEIGIRLEFLGGDKQKVLLWNRFIPMTTVSQMGSILDDLGMTNAEVIYYGWQPLGASSMAPTDLVLERREGSLGELGSLVEKIQAGGGNFYLYLDPQAALTREKGYSPRYDLAMSITNINLWGYNRNMSSNYLNLGALSERYSSLSLAVFSTLNAGLALDEIGSLLYSDFKEKNFVNRETTILQYQELLAAGNGRTAFYVPNDYMFQFMQAYYDIPITDSGYIYTTDTIPFLQIVLAGYVPFYGPALNFSSDIQMDLLRCIEYDVYPSFFLTNEVTARILDTQSNWIYTSSYEQWKEPIKETYGRLNGILGQVKNQEIIAHRSLMEGVVAVTYSNGIQIIINYNDHPYYGLGTMVEGMDAVARQVSP